VEANIGRSSAKVLTEHAVLVVSCFKLASWPGIFTVLGCAAAWVGANWGHWGVGTVPDSGRRLASCCFCREPPIPSAPCPTS